MFNKIIVTSIDEIFTVNSPKGRYEKIHDRKTYGLSFCMDGQITYTHNGRKIISDKNHAVILPKDQTYTLYGDKTGSFPVINFTALNSICDTVVSLPIQNAEAYLHDYEKIKSLSLFDGNNAEIMSIFYHILHRMSAQSTAGMIIMPAVKYIEKNYNNPMLSNRQLAHICNISEVYLRRLFLQFYNMTPKQFILDIRLNKAKQLLSEGMLKINAAAQECGFTNQYHFCRIFKQKVGMTPTEYIAQNRIYKI